jgi:hypothetical protein
VDFASASAAMQAWAVTHDYTAAHLARRRLQGRALDLIDRPAQIRWHDLGKLHRRILSERGVRILMVALSIIVIGLLLAIVIASVTLPNRQELISEAANRPIRKPPKASVGYLIMMAVFGFMILLPLILMMVFRP